MDVDIIHQSEHNVVSPVCYGDKIFFLTHNTGDLVELELDDVTKTRKIVNTGGQPSSVAVLNNDTIYITDYAFRAILLYDKERGVRPIVKDYDGKPFLGPNHIIMGPSKSIYFTDSGVLGTTSISNNLGSVFVIKMDFNRPIVTPIIYKSLAHPCGIAISDDERYIFVCEMLNNRILRFVERPRGVYHCSVFKQFSGGLGPHSIIIARDYMFVAHYDFSSRSLIPSAGMISILSLNGDSIDTITIPAPEISGMSVDSSLTYLYVSESSSNTIYRVNISSYTEVPNDEEMP